MDEELVAPMTVQPAQASGKSKNPPEYQTVLDNLKKLTEALRLNEFAFNSLKLAFTSKEWIGIADEPSVEQLVKCAVGRVKQNPDEYKTFIAMLDDIEGMDQVLKDLEVRYEHLRARFHENSSIVVGVGTAEERQPIAADDSSRKALAESIRQNFNDILHYIKPHIDTVVGEAFEAHLIEQDVLIQCTRDNEEKNKVATLFITHVIEIVYTGGSQSYDRFLSLLHSDTVNPSSLIKKFDPPAKWPPARESSRPCPEQSESNSEGIFSLVSEHCSESAHIQRATQLNLPPNHSGAFNQETGGRNNSTEAELERGRSSPQTEQCVFPREVPDPIESEDEKFPHSTSQCKSKHAAEAHFQIETPKPSVEELKGRIGELTEQIKTLSDANTQLKEQLHELKEQFRVKEEQLRKRIRELEVV